MKIKKQRLIIAVFVIMTLLFISPIKTLAVASCTESECKGGTLDNGCTSCCWAFDREPGLGKEKFIVNAYYKTFNKDCNKYIDFIKDIVSNPKSANTAAYCISACTDTEGYSQSNYNSCLNSCCKEVGCSVNDITATNNSTSNTTNKNATTNNKKTTTKDTSNNSSNNNTINTCEGILGDKTNDKTVAWLIDKILSYLKILGPLLIVVLSSVDFAKTIIMSDEENMKKAQKKLITRLLAAVLLFFVPTLVQLLLDIFGITSCNIY